MSVYNYKRPYYLSLYTTYNSEVNYHINLYNAEVFLYKPGRRKFCFNLGLLPLEIFNSVSAGSVFRRQNLTSTDARFATCT